MRGGAAAAAPWRVAMQSQRGATTSTAVAEYEPRGRVTVEYTPCLIGSLSKMDAGRIQIGTGVGVTANAIFETEKKVPVIL